MTKTAKLINLLLPVGILLSFSLTILGSISSTYLEQQAISIGIATFVFILFYVVDYHAYRLFPWVLYGITVVSLVSTFLFGQLARGSIRWIEIGAIRFQPSEFAKPLLIIFFAYFISQTKKTPKAYLFLLLMCLLPTALIFFQPDLGSSLIVASIIAGQLIASHIPKKYLIFTIVPLLVASPLLWGMLKPYQKDRVSAFLDPMHDPLGRGYNAIQAVISVGSGGVNGRGLGQGTQSQLKFLPERQTDFVYAAISEEFGFFGSLTIVGSYVWLLSILIKYGQHARDEMGRLICVGTFFTILIQAFVNIGMNAGLLPITGITLPLVSLGGSSLLSLAVLLGIVANIHQTHHESKAALEIK